ncbi:hypothetical protein AGOR_G00093150 [Albula goreensis]|uniref:CTCK domain-containing protein n=1 Tax=Albula goreensis TaxID=1534307 RepID=A0A8T3DMT6_9TELE|nr:hypothetical protein AGOR_G00093150 [Albula goreensis]
MVKEGNKPAETVEEVTEKKPLINQDGSITKKKVEKKGDTVATITEVTKEVTKGDKPIEKTEESTEKSTVVSKDGSSTTTTVTKKGDTITTVTVVIKGKTTTTTTKVSKGGKTTTTVQIKSTHTQPRAHTAEECKCDSVPRCQMDEELVPVPVKGTCCPRLHCEKKRSTCGLVSQDTFINRKSCQSKVKLPGCGGLCASSFQYSSDGKWKGTCGCCQPTAFHSQQVLLRCGDGSMVTETLSVPAACSCKACK